MFLQLVLNNNTLAAVGHLTPPTEILQMFFLKY